MGCKTSIETLWWHLLFHFPQSRHLLSYFITLHCSSSQSVFPLFPVGKVISKWHCLWMWWCSCSSVPTYCPLPEDHGLGESGCAEDAGNRAHKWIKDGRWQDNLVIMTVDPFPVMYSGHLGASGRKCSKREHREEKASGKTSELLVMCQETNLGWQCCMCSGGCGQPVVCSWNSAVGFSLQGGTRV